MGAHSNGMVEFRPESGPESSTGAGPPLTALSVDDDPAFQHSLRLALADYSFNGRPLRLITASSLAEAEALLEQTPELSAILLDVVMETDDAGLRLVRRVREGLGNAEVRIVLVTGQPGVAPMRETLQQLDISDYWLKTELYRERLHGVMTSTLRTWTEIRALGRTKRGMQQIVEAGQRLAGLRDVGVFSVQMLHRLAELLEVPPDGLVVVRAEGAGVPAGRARLVGATGCWTANGALSLEDIDDAVIRAQLLDALTRRVSIASDSSQVLFFDGAGLAPGAAVYLATGRPLDDQQRELLGLFATQANSGMANADLAARLDRLAYQDELLGIANGNALQQELQRILAAPRPCGHGLMLVETDQYVHGGVALGPEHGDRLLCDMATRLARAYPPPCVVARLHEGTFAIVGPSALIGSDPVVALEMTDDDGRLPFLGVAAARVDLDAYRGSPRGALATGLLGLSRARTEQAQEVVEYRPEHEATVQARFLQSRALYAAVQESRIRIHLQPQVDMRDGRVVGAEALARWTDGDGSPVSPAEFIPIAEASGLIVPLGEQVIGQVCRALHALSEAGFPELPIAVNVSPLQLRRREFVAGLIRQIERHGIAPQRLEIEITESAAMTGHRSSNDVLARLRDLGFAVSVDDFGTGYSSLRYVHSLPVTRLKIDRHFIDGIDPGSGPVERPVAEMIISLGQRLELEVLAEGVEEPAQAEWLLARGCNLAQGYLFGRPVPQAEFIAGLRKARGGD